VYQNNEDILLNALLLQGEIRVMAVSGKELVKEAQRVHALSRVCTAALGRQLMATAMMASQLKHEDESLTTILRGDGPVGNLVCTGRYGAKVKGYVANPGVELPPTPAGKLDVGGAVGREGKLTVVRDLYLREPYVGETSLVSGEIAEDFAQYFAVSEQQPGIVYLGVRVRPETGEVLSAGGLIAQPLPGCPDEALSALQDAAPAIAGLARMLEEKPLAEALAELFKDMELEITGELGPLWECDCSRERTNGRSSRWAAGNCAI